MQTAADSQGGATGSARGAHATTCPFCGLLCDDVIVATDRAGAVTGVANGCRLSREGYAGAPGAVRHGPMVRGRASSFEQAVAAAARLLDRSSQSLFGGLAVDIASMRVLVELADRCGAVVDHGNSRAKFRNLLAFQDRGAITTTLAEARNRADLLIVIGTDVVSRFPRFFERIAPGPAAGEFASPGTGRRIVFVGDHHPPPAEAGTANTLFCAREQLPQLLGALAALASGARLQADRAGDVSVERLRELAAAMRQARYGVIAWSAADLEFAHAELAVQAIMRIVFELNRTTRFAALPLGGSEGDLSADAVLLWQVGYPFRTGFAAGRPEYDPCRFDSARMLASGEADALLWVSVFGDRLSPPEHAPPTILLSVPWAAAAPRCEVFLPVGTPGVDFAGHLVRTDKVLTMRVEPVRAAAAAPSPALVLRAIVDALPQA
jgi:formylmethanofuran dehydrogenase subunit B